MSIEQSKEVIQQLEHLKEERITDCRNMFYEQFHTYEEHTLFNIYRRILIIHSIESEIKEINRIIDIEKNKINKQLIVKNNDNLDLNTVYASDNSDWLM